MTPTEAELLLAVAEAAIDVVEQIGLGSSFAAERLYETVDKYRAYRATPAVEWETVEVRAHVRINRVDPEKYVVEGLGLIDGSHHYSAPPGTIATIAARVPLRVIPTIEGSVT